MNKNLLTKNFHSLIMHTSTNHTQTPLGGPVEAAQTPTDSTTNALSTYCHRGGSLGFRDSRAQLALSFRPALTFLEPRLRGLFSKLRPHTCSLSLHSNALLKSRFFGTAVPERMESQSRTFFFISCVEFNSFVI